MHCLVNVWRSSVSLVSFGRALIVDAPTKLEDLHPKEALAVGRLIWLYSAGRPSEVAEGRRVEYGTEVRWSQRMKALEHYNTGMKFAPNSQSRKIKLLPRSSSRLGTEFSKDNSQSLKEFPSALNLLHASFVQLDHTTSQ